MLRLRLLFRHHAETGRCAQGWGYWKYPVIPSVDAWKFLDSRRMTNICERWAKDHTNALQYALFNGDGFESWENVWGTWNGEQMRCALRCHGPQG